MKETEILKIFKRVQAIQTGHFLLTSGMHSDIYIQCARILERPLITARLGKMLTRPWAGKKIDVVAAPAVGGIVLAYELARLLKARAIYLERVNGQLTLRRGFAIQPEEKVLVVEDVITTGGSTREVVEVIKVSGGVVVGVASLVDRRPGVRGDKKLFQARFNTCLKITPPLYQPGNCPLCQKGMPVVKPGSRGLKA